MRDNRSIFANLDWISILIYFLLVFLGWISIYAAVYNEEHSRITDLSQEYGRQLLFILGSLILIVFILFTDGRLFEKLSIPVYVLMLALLAGVLVAGSKISGARSWYQFGAFSLQPSEFMKFATALALSKLLAGDGRDAAARSRKRMPNKALVALIILLPVGFILPQPDLGSALVYTAFLFPLHREGMPAWVIYSLIWAAFLFILSLMVDLWWLWGGLAGLALMLGWIFRKEKGSWWVLSAILVLSIGLSLSVDYAFNNLLEDRHRNRINILLGKAEDPSGIGYNTNQSIIAIGSGGFAGKGFLEGTQTKFDFVPEQSTDFIFCTVGEEWGFVGSVLVVVLFSTLLVRIILLAERQRSTFSRIYGYSVASILFLHVAVNLSMTVGLAPVIGIPLPFFSYGGSSLWGFTLLFFIFIRLDAYRMQIL